VVTLFLVEIQGLQEMEEMVLEVPEELVVLQV
jgi:hypothetical protein